MSIAIAITVTQSTYTKTTLPPAAGATASRTMAATDKGITDLAERVRKEVENLFLSIDPNSHANTTVSVTVT